MTRRILAVALVAVIAAAGTGVVVGFGLGPFAGSASGTLGAPHFVDETASAGLTQTYDGVADRFDVGGGVAVFDCNGDGKPDVYAAGGSNPAALFRNDSKVGGALKFSRVADPATDLTNVIGAYPLDVDGDGRPDLVVLRVGETEILRGLPDCRFELANAALSFDAGTGFATAFSATWEGANNLPTLALGRYRTLEPSGSAGFDCADDALFRPRADGGGYGPPLALKPGYCALSMLFSDWDRSGRRDLRVTNDRNYYGTNGEDQLWRMEPGAAPRQYTADDGWVTLQLFGMGIAGYDVTGDGFPDYYLTSQGDNKLQTLTAGASQPTYRDIASKRGVNAAQPFTGGQSLPSTAWHPEFEDVNNDGFIDLFVSKGNVSAQPDFATKDPSDLFIGRADGTFVEGAGDAGIVSFDRGRGAALADFNLDGMLDLVEVNYEGPVRVWRNVGSGDAGHPAQMGNWLGVRLTESGGNRDAIGAWLEVKTGDRTMRRELTVGGGHAGGQLGWTHVGLGTAKEADVHVVWPDGTTGDWTHVGSNQFVEIARGSNAVTPWQPQR